MGTRSNIIVKRQDGKWHRIYCHWDGYLSHNGRILAENYNSQAKAEKLVKGGDISSLAESCDLPKGKPHSFENRVEGYTVYYGRDRGEQNCAGWVEDTLEAACPPKDSWTKYTYVWDGNQWLVGNPENTLETLVNLEGALIEEMIQKEKE